MSIGGENCEGSIIPFCSGISRFSRSTLVRFPHTAPVLSPVLGSHSRDELALSRGLFHDPRTSFAGSPQAACAFLKCSENSFSNLRWWSSLLPSFAPVSKMTSGHALQIARTGTFPIFWVISSCGLFIRTSMTQFSLSKNPPCNARSNDLRNVVVFAFLLHCYQADSPFAAADLSLGNTVALFFGLVRRICG